MKQLLLILCVLSAAFLFAQQPSFQWVKGAGSTGYDKGVSITTDDVGNIYSTGSFQNTVDFNPGSGVTNLTAEGDRDIYIQKLDGNGGFVWAKSIGGTSIDEGVFVTTDNAGNVYTTGYFGGTVDFDPGPGITNLTSAGIYDVFIQKLDANGDFVWAKRMGGADNDQGQSITTDALGNVYTIGIFRGNTVDFDPGPGLFNLTSAGDYDIFIQKLDANGDFVWAKSMGGTSIEKGISIATDNMGNVYSTGRFNSNTADFNPGSGVSNLTSAGNFDIFIQKLNPNGGFVWVRRAGGTADDSGISITIDGSNNVYTTGFFGDTVDFDPGVGVTDLAGIGVFDIYIQKLDANGNFVWAKSMGGTNIDEGYSITTDDQGNVYSTGIFRGTVDFDPGSGVTNLTAGFYDAYIQKLNGNGNFIWAESIGGGDLDESYSITTDGTGNVYTTGYFENTADFDPGPGVANLTSAGNSDIYVHKLSQCVPNTGAETVTSCDSFIWQANGNSYNSTGTYTATLTNSGGCDSVVTLNLTINSVSDLTTSTSELTIAANNTNATYQWLDCNDNFTPISGETGQTFTASGNGDYAVQLTENGCVDTTSCVSITTVGIDENTFGDEFLVYPNPTREGEFSVDLGSIHKTAKVSIRDLSGRLIDAKSIHQAHTLNLSINEPAGTYLITILSGDQKAVIRLVIE